MKTQLYCGVSSRAYNVKKIVKDFSQLPRSAEYYATIYKCDVKKPLPDLYDIYLTTSGQYYARLITY